MASCGARLVPVARAFRALRVVFFCAAMVSTHPALSTLQKIILQKYSASLIQC